MIILVSISCFQKTDRRLHGKPFSFQFDETSTQQVKKQYDGYIVLFSNSQKIVIEYCGSLFVGRCTSDDLGSHFFEFMKLKLNLSLLLVLGMDGPSVSRYFEKKLKARLEENYTTQILDIGTCSLHIVNNAFLEGLKELKNEINLDEFAIDLHFFMKYSAARRGNYVNIVSVTLRKEILLLLLLLRYGNHCSLFIETLHN